ncbi:HAD family hydrolase [Streptacidiphilus cavernicola]|uniref:HAD family hydrolase n=1 Tax=Streptacidiphilus cavernicola TaxID=3342716 RepID=A0ABV6VZP1_9ACTN
MSPLLLFDLDNTLVNRNEAFQSWAERFLADRSLPPGDLGWFMTLDCGGYLDRRVLLRAAADRYGLSQRLEPLLADYRDTVTALIRCPTAHLDALREARAAGWTLGIVSNGATDQQRAKIERTGLAELVDGWIISEEVDCAKPDPRIFTLAAGRCGIDPGIDWTAEAWMVGDHAPADIAGAAVAGIRSVWLAHGRAWPETGYHPTLTAAGLPEAVSRVLASPTASPVASASASPPTTATEATAPATPVPAFARVLSPAAVAAAPVAVTVPAPVAVPVAAARDRPGHPCRHGGVQRTTVPG